MSWTAALRASTTTKRLGTQNDTVREIRCDAGAAGDTRHARAPRRKRRGQGARRGALALYGRGDGAAPARRDQRRQRHDGQAGQPLVFRRQGRARQPLAGRHGRHAEHPRAHGHRGRAHRRAHGPHLRRRRRPRQRKDLHRRPFQLPHHKPLPGGQDHRLHRGRGRALRRRKPGACLHPPPHPRRLGPREGGAAEDNLLAELLKGSAGPHNHHAV